MCLKERILGGFIGIKLINLVLVKLHSNYLSDFPNLMTGIFKKRKTVAYMPLWLWIVMKLLNRTNVNILFKTPKQNDFMS